MMTIIVGYPMIICVKKHLASLTTYVHNYHQNYDDFQKIGSMTVPEMMFSETFIWNYSDEICWNNVNLP